VFYLEDLVLLTIKIVNSRVLIATIPVSLDLTQTLEGLSQGLVLGSDRGHIVVVVEVARRVGGGGNGESGECGMEEEETKDENENEKLVGRRGWSICSGWNGELIGEFWMLKLHVTWLVLGSRTFDGSYVKVRSSFFLGLGSFIGRISFPQNKLN
jgi:hypothetical protein